MTNEEKEALIARGWTPPVAVDPDIAEAWDLVGWRGWSDNHELVLSAIKRGRELERAEAKPGLVWVKHDGSAICPVDPDSYVWIKRGNSSYAQTTTCYADAVGWHLVTHYAIITQPEDVA